MSLIYKNIQKVSLLIAGLVVLAHSIIPHDHHFDSHSELYQHHHDCENSDKQPIHCHFFNNIDLEKVETNTVNNTKLPTYLPTAIVYQVKTTVAQKNSAFIISNCTLPNYCTFISLAPTRGSPLV